MGGFAGIGGSSTKTDRAAQLQSTGNLNNIFNWAMPAGQAGQAAGSNALGGAQDYFSKLLTAGRTDTAAMAAPAIQSAQASGTATRTSEGNLGTGRSGGTVAANREASSTSGKQIDDLIAKTLQSNKQQGAMGLASTGATQLSNAGNLLGLGENAESSIMGNATQSRLTQEQIDAQSSTGFGKLLGMLAFA